MSIRKASTKSASTAVGLRLQGVMDPSIAMYIRDLRRRYGRYATSAEDVRTLLDKTMGNKTLTELLYEARQ